MSDLEALPDSPADKAQKPAFLITIDTEGDNIWTRPRDVSTENSKYLPRFQSLCEKYALKPTYLVNYEMAKCGIFVEFARDALRRGTAEIGMHLHAWNSPPVKDGGTGAGLPYLIEFPEPVMREKVAFMTGLLENEFGTKMVSHRSGRWALNETYVQILLDHEYRVDCSVTPHVSWREAKGFPDGQGGSDYRAFPSEPYFIDPANIGRPGHSPLLEVPMTIAENSSFIGSVARAASGSLPNIVRKGVKRVFPQVQWFRPNGRNLPSMLRLLERRKSSTYIEFMLHSSELMPGGSPTFQTERSIETLYDQLEATFDAARSHYSGLTLHEFRDRFDEPAAQDCARSISVR